MVKKPEKDSFVVAMKHLAKLCETTHPNDVSGLWVADTIRDALSRRPKSVK